MHTNFDTFDVQNMQTFSIQIAFKIFSVTVLLLIYYCDQFVAPEIRHSRCHCSVLSTNNMVFSDEDKILVKCLYLKRYTAI